MNVRVKFLGGAQSVTGSKYLLEVDDFKLLIDCGLFQGLKELRLRNWDDFPVNPKEINAAIITHAHIDHTGYLPRLFRQGFSGPVYCSEPTADLVEILLLDSAKLQEEEAAFAKKKGYSKHEDPQPLYNTLDAKKVFPHLVSSSFNKTVRITNKIEAKFFDSGHILGSSIVELTIKGDQQTKKIVFSGDLGRYDNPILRDPSPVEEADILFVESTYGNRNNPMNAPEDRLAAIINETFEKGGCVVIPAFAVGRTQTMLYFLDKLFDEKKIPEVPVYIDSPMAISVTALYKKYVDYHELDDDKLGETNALFDRWNYHYYRDQDSSSSLNDLRGNAIIISASGMSTGGRILHHMYHRLPRPNDTYLIVGYQPEGTRGRKLLDGESTVKIFGLQVQVNCSVKHVDGLSAHADQAELFRWLSCFKGSPKKTFIVHGEEQSAGAFASLIREKFGWNVYVPVYLETAELFSGI